MLRYTRAVFDVAGTLLMIVAASALLWRMYHAPTRPTTAPAVEEVENVTVAANRITNTRGSGRVVLIEFGDYECPFCARHKQGAGRMLTEEFVQPGLIQHAFLDFPLDIHPLAFKAAEAAECAARQGKFWEMHESLFANPKALAPSDLADAARTIGLNETEFVECLGKDEATEAVEWIRRRGEGLASKERPLSFWVSAALTGRSI